MLRPGRNSAPNNRRTTQESVNENLRKFGNCVIPSPPQKSVVTLRRNPDEESKTGSHQVFPYPDA